MSALRHLWTHHRVVFIAFLGASLVTLLFLVRLTVFSLYWADPAHRNQPPAPWMTPGYVAHSWGLDPRAVTAAIGAGTATDPRPTLQSIARDRGVPVEIILNEINTLLAESPRQ